MILSVAAGASTYFTVCGGSSMFFGSHLKDVAFELGYSVKSLILNLSILVMVYLPGVWIPGALFSLSGLIIKGFLQGFAAGAVVSEMGFLSIPVLLFALIIPESIILMILTAVSMKAFSEWFSRIKGFTQSGKSVPVSKIYIKQVLLYTLLLMLAVLFGAIMSSLAFRILL